MVTCDHKFVVCDAHGGNNFLCRECDERFTSHPLIYPEEIRAPSNSYININGGDIVHIYDCGIFRKSTVTLHSMSYQGIQVQYPYRNYLLNIPFERLQAPCYLDDDLRWEYNHLHVDLCARRSSSPHQQHRCAFKDPKCPLKMPNLYDV